MNRSFYIVKGLLAEAGVTINGDKPYDIVVHDEQFYQRALSGSLGFGESYMDKQWDCPKLDELITRIHRAELPRKIEKNISLFLKIAKERLVNLQTKKRALVVGKRHYDLGNEFFQKMLGPTMAYSCGYDPFGVKSLDEAQTDKFDLICRKINLKEGDRILDIGCGWGGFALHAATRYGASVVGITISKEQAAFAEKLCKHTRNVEIRLKDYRDVNEKFDHVVSVGMMEHVGPKNYQEYMQTVDRCLKKNGLFLLHTIGSDKRTNYADSWFDEYIFPNSVIPTACQLDKAYAGIFTREDMHNFGPCYDRTLMHWYANFKEHLQELQAQYGETFCRMMEFYLLCSAGGFRARELQLWQFVFSKKREGGYQSIR